MKVGDLVKAEHSETIGIVIDVVQKKVWRSGIMGKKVNWDLVDPEPHAAVLYSHNNDTVNIPFTELEVVNEGR